MAVKKVEVVLVKIQTFVFVQYHLIAFTPMEIPAMKCGVFVGKPNAVHPQVSIVFRVLSTTMKCIILQK
jgi:hypothetical protein